MNSISFGNIRIHDDLVCPAPPLDGAPHSEGESVLLTEQFAFLTAIQEDAAAYSGAQSNNQMKGILKGVCRRLLQDPSYCEKYLITLNAAPDLIFELSDKFQASRLDHLHPESAQDFIQAVREKKGREIEQLSDAIRGNLGRFSSYLGQIYSRESLGQWLNLVVSGQECAKPAQEVLRELFISCQQVDLGLPRMERFERRVTKTLDFLYAFAEAIVAAKDPVARDFGWRMLAFDTDIFAMDSSGFDYFAMGAFASNDPDLQKFMEIDSVVSRLTPDELSDIEEKYHDGLGRALTSDKYQEFSAELQRRCPDRLKLLLDYYDCSEDLVVDQGVPPAWPDSLIVNAGPLRTALHNFIASSDPSYAAYWMPGVEGLMLVSPAQIELEKFEFKPSDDGVVSLPGQVKTLFYLSPELDIEVYQRLAADLPTLREQITHNMSHLINPRGDKMMIVDPELKALGFKWILFEKGSGLKTAGITIAVGEYQFQFNLGKDLDLRDRHSNEPLAVPFHRNAFLEHVVLSHLHELMCTKNIMVNGDKSLMSDDPDSLRRFKGRRPHFRKLPEGQGFTPEQWALAFQREDGFDLHDFNAKLRLTRKTGQKTYVKQIDPDADYGPFVTSAPQSMQRTRMLMGGSIAPTSTEAAETQPEA